MTLVTGSPPTAVGDATRRPASSLLELLELEVVGTDLYRTVWLRDEPHPLYGGQVAAQALHAAGRTVPSERLPHSLHGYFLRPGNSSAHVVYRVERDLDGRTYSGRRVVALQDGKPIFTMSASFTEPITDAVREADPAPDVSHPESLKAVELPRVLSLESRQLPRDESLSTRFWARCSDSLPDDSLIHACVLTYISDVSSRRYLRRGGAKAWWETTIDHTVWFHTPARLDEWVLTDKAISSVTGRRGLYQASVHDQQGTLIASLAQEGVLHVPG